VLFFSKKAHSGEVLKSDLAKYIKYFKNQMALLDMSFYLDTVCSFVSYKIDLWQIEQMLPMLVTTFCMNPVGFIFAQHIVTASAHTRAQRGPNLQLFD